MKCFDTQTLAAHLDGELTLNESQAVTAHLESCSLCQAQLARLRRTVAALPSALPVPEDAAFTRQVMAQLGSQHPAPRRLTWAAGFAAAVAVLFAVLLIPRQQASPPGVAEFTARGGAHSQAVAFTVYVHPGSAPTRRQPATAGQPVRPQDGFSFEVHNHTGKPRFAALFAFDSKGETHWFYPAVTADGDDPAAVALPAQPALLALPDGITPEAVAPGELKLVGLFLTEPLRVSEVESLLHQGSLDSLAQKLPGATVQTVVLNAIEENPQ